ncbi:MAG: bifunctional phosphopantothenoylcysteine decarboxylase/phosphopantothenate--cysteine ligase CoaBC [Ignavibacterium sp.]|nr:bifunctional phosphopantothenoylcysteine decarboxylase/phosphopantothenate--cysteine ligase CoaBC [Ignavibacterium sp.]
MSKFKILFKISGSIAAYKSAYLISKLVQNNFEVQTVATLSALEFIGSATLEGLTGKPVLIDQYESGKMMSHINLTKWADLILLCPASANTINKMANGIADNLVTSLFLANDFNKPYIVAPAMNTSMFNHPSTQQSLQKLKDWGIIIMPTESGHLACGDVGEGKLINPDLIYDKITELLTAKVNKKSSRASVLITGGATRESIDGVRFISNLSTGKTAAGISDFLSSKNYDVTFLYGQNSVLPKLNSELIQFTDHKSLETLMDDLLRNRHFDFVIHLAAVSDFTVGGIYKKDKKIKTTNKIKLESSSKNLSLNLKPTSKIVDKIKKISKNDKLILFAFKFSAEDDMNKSNEKVHSLFKHSNSDYVILNHLQDRKADGSQTNFYLFDKNGLLSKIENPNQLSESIEQIIMKHLEKK